MFSDFYCCYKDKSDSDKPHFFCKLYLPLLFSLVLKVLLVWANDPILVRPPPSSHPQPTPSQSSRGMVTPPVTPRKDYSSPASQRRLAAIEAALADANDEIPPQTPTRKRPHSPSSSPASTQLTPAQRRRRLAAIEDALSQAPGPSSSYDPISSFPSSLPKREEEDPMLPVSNEEDEASFWQAPSARSSPATNRTYKHDHEGLLHSPPARSSHHTALSLPSPPPSTRKEPPGSTDDGDDDDGRPTPLLRDLGRLPAYIRKLEGKAAAAAQGVRSRDARNTELEGTVARSVTCPSLTSH